MNLTKSAKTVGQTRRPVRVGVVGVGTMGQHHARVLSQLNGVQLAGVSDPDKARCQEIADRYHCQAFDDYRYLVEVVDGVTIAAPTSLHVKIGLDCVDRGVHVLVEKPLATDASSARMLADRAGQKGVVLMVGHIERYNPATRKMIDVLRTSDEEVVSIHTNRLAPFDGSRCMDVDVVLDLLIHDIDLVLDIADAKVTDLAAFGRSVYSHQVDVVHVSMKFANNVVASCWTSKCSPQKLRSVMVTTSSRFFEANTLEQTLRICTAESVPDLQQGCLTMGTTCMEAVPVLSEEPLRIELTDFIGAISSDRNPIVDGCRAVNCLEILDKIRLAIQGEGQNTAKRF